jgi:hypothetical protein
MPQYKAGHTGAPWARSSTPAHTYGADCPNCGDGRSGTRCDLGGYSPRRVQFLLAHREALETAYLNPSGAAASNELARLEREWRTLPPRHSCSCPRLNKRSGVIEYHCWECRRLGEAIPRQDIAPEFVGRRPAGQSSTQHARHCS